jgi:transposase
MTKRATAIQLTQQERDTLTNWLEMARRCREMAQRARMILLADEGHTTLEIAHELGTRPARVSKWRTRFAAQGLDGLADFPKGNRWRERAAAADIRVLKIVNEPPPTGHHRWTGELIAEVLGDISPDRVWRILRRRGIRLDRRYGQCLDVESGIEPRDVELVGLFLDRTSQAIAVSAAAAGQRFSPGGRLLLPDRELVSAFRSALAGRPAGTLVESLETAAALVRAGRFIGPGRRELAHFARDVAATAGSHGLHVLMAGEGLPRLELANLTVCTVPARADWIRDLDRWLGVCHRPAAREPGPVRRLIQAAREFVLASIEHAAVPFEWWI